MKISGLRVDIQEVQGPFCKVVGIKEFPDLIYNGKFCGPSPRFGGLAACSGPRWTTSGVDTRRSGALPVRGAWALGSPELASGAQQGEGDTGNSMGYSPGRGQQCGGRATAVKNGGGLSSSQGRRGSGERGKGVVRSRGGACFL
jgi:hypothetical protein